MKSVLLIITGLLVGLSAYAQICTDDNRFTQVEYFDNTQIDSSMNVIYATVNDNQELGMDIYYPQSAMDTFSQRPFILLAHGGGFVAGNRGLMRNTCVEFAKRGFVAATVTYRLGTGPLTTLDPIYQAEQDAHAAMRYIIENASTYRVDTTWLFTGGESAGSNIALAMAYTDQQDWDTINSTMSATYGGLYTSGNDLTNSYDIKGVFNNWGALLGPAFDSLRNVSIISFHGEQDQIIDIDFNMNTFYGGSRWIYQATTNFGHCNSLNIDSLGNHGIYQGQMGLAYRVASASCFFRSVFCGTCSSISTYETVPPNCAMITSVAEINLDDEISVFPNPFHDNLQITGLVGDEYFILSSISGQIISEGYRVDMLNVRTLNPGIYFLSIGGQSTQKVIQLIKR